ncbi:MAG: HEAT repeat domain-containing protein [Anaerolineae bacterium]|nr:HEAT repeat domain-containing protein [Anaerolineae bacterium]
MRFDPLSFLLGFLSAAGVSALAWRHRTRLNAVRQSAESQVEGTRRFVGRTADARYYHDLLLYIQRHHVAGDLIDLTDILLEPRLIPPPAPVMVPGSEDVSERNVFDVVPQFHDMPQSYAPYNIPTLALDDLGAGDRHVAILGISGMGKTTALVTLALMAMGEIKFESLEELTEQAIEEEEQSLSKEERKERAEERERMKMRALEKLHTTQELQQEQLAEFQAKEEEELPVLDVTRLVPVFVHLSDLEFDAAVFGKGAALDPAEPLIRAVQRQVGSVTGQVVGSVIYPALEAGRALILLDGYDEFSPAAREVYFYWLQQLLAAYGHNLVVIAGPAQGYEPLVTLGFAPTFLRPWREDDFAWLAKRWREQWLARSKGRRRAPAPDEQTMRRITVDNRGRTALDVTLKIWTSLADDTRQTGRAGWYDAWITRRLSKPDARSALPALAVQVLQAGRPVKRALLEQVSAQPPAGSEDGKDGARPGNLIDVLARDGLLVEHPGGTFDFAHPQLMHFLASEVLVQQGTEQATEMALDPLWTSALGFAAARLNMVPVIYRKLSSTPDLLYNNLFGLVRWLPDAPPDAPWRGDIFKRLAAALMAPEQYPEVRARAMAALIAARDKNVLFIFRQALRSTDADVRRLGCVGLGALGSTEAIKDLAPMLTDDDRGVQLGAGLALGAIGTEAALEAMVHALLEGTEDLRQAVAEAFAAIPGEGHAILRDGIKAQDIMIRRATVYGLARVNASWALIELYRAMLEDEQWYVRAAAEEAFLDAQSPIGDGPHAHPEADSLLWLIQWAADHGEGVPAGVNARAVLIRVLQEGEPVYQTLAARTLGRLAHVPALKPLYLALRNRHPDVRGAAYAALMEIQMCLGQPLPGLV